MCATFFNLQKARAPAYLFSKVPVERNVPDSLRRHHAYPPVNRVERFANSYFRNALIEWNLLDTSMKDSNTREAFKSILLGVIRPIKIQRTLSTI